MNGLTWFVAFIMPYVAIAVLAIGIGGRTLRWALMPRHVPWTLYPPPEGLLEQMRFMAGEIFAFRALFRQNRPLWISAWIFHIAMALLGLWFVLFVAAGGFTWLAKLGLILLGITAAYMMVYRRVVPQARAVSQPVEFFNLGLFLAIAVVGIVTVLRQTPDADTVRQYLVSLLSFRPAAVPQDSWFLLLLVLVEIFFIYFPFSRMVHMVSKYFGFHTINWEHRSYR